MICQITIVYACVCFLPFYFLPDSVAYWNIGITVQPSFIYIWWDKSGSLERLWEGDQYVGSWLVSALVISICGEETGAGMDWGRKCAWNVTLSHSWAHRELWRKDEWQVSDITQLCPTLCDPMDCSLPGSSVQGIFQARVLEWVDISFSRGSSRPRDLTQIFRNVGRRFTIWATPEMSGVKMGGLNDYTAASASNWMQATCSKEHKSWVKWFLWPRDIPREDRLLGASRTCSSRRNVSTKSTVSTTLHIIVLHKIFSLFSYTVSSTWTWKLTYWVPF